MFQLPEKIFGVKKIALLDPYVARQSGNIAGR